ncbi:MAG: Imm52 family immunity protein, partial [Hyalangium sp.]
MTATPIPEGYYAGAYWGPRKESPEECAERT